MAKIGKMYRDENGFSGQFCTLTMDVRFSLHRNPEAGQSNESPQFLASCNGIELGAAWEKTIMKGQQQGQKFYSISMDDPSFPSAINVTAFPSKDDGHQGGFDIMWNRPKEKQRNGTGLAIGTGMAPLNNGQREEPPFPDGEGDYGR